MILSLHQYKIGLKMKCNINKINKCNEKLDYKEI